MAMGGAGGGVGGMGGNGGDGGDGGMMVVPGLRLTPEEVTLEIADEPQTAQFTLEEVAADGTAQVLDPSEAQWSVNPATLGQIDGATGVFTASNELGRGRVEVQRAGEFAVAVIEVVGDSDVIDEGTDADAPDRFDMAGRQDGCAPTLLYPEPFTVFPRTMNGLEVQWEANGHDLFMLEFVAGAASVRYFTHRDAYVPAGETWDTLLRSAAVGGTMTLRLVGLGGAGADACGQAPVSLGVDTSTLTGAIYYWSTGDAGIMRLAVDETEPEPFLTPAVAPQINCPACHALSRDGSRIAFTRTTFPPFGELSTSLVDTPADLLYDPQGIAGYFPSWAPDNARLVGGSNGDLVIRNADTGAEIERLPRPENTAMGSPDWSWQGDRIVATVGPGGLGNPLPDAGISGGSIYTWAGAAGMWMQPQRLVERFAERWLDRPAFSPDGDWVVFNSIGDNPSNEEGMGNTNIDLWIVASTGGVPIRLNLANRGQEMLGNSWPKWAPDDNRGRLWVAFSSTRDYGHRLRNGAREFANPQIWVTSIDVEAAMRGEDPSSPAFWLPYQDLESGNHIPYWAVYEKQ